MKSPSPQRFLLAATLITGLALTTLAPAGDAATPNHKTWQETLSVDADATGVTGATPISTGTHELYFTIKNTSVGSQAVPFGSFQIQVPSGISVSAAVPGSLWKSNFNNPVLDTSVTPNTITVTSTGPTGSGIAPDSSIRVHVTAYANAGVCPGTWTTFVKQSNDFSGNGNDFTGTSVATPVSGGTQLIWTTQPTDTEFDLDMSPSPQVTLEDACGNPVAITGTVTVTDAAAKLTPPTVAVSGGTATLGGVQFTDYAFTDTLTATANGVSGTSNSFSVFQFRQPCGSGPCKTPTLSGPLGDTLATITTDSGTAGDLLTVNVKGLATGTCNGTTAEPPLGEVVSLNINNRGKTVTMTLPKVYVNQIPNNGTPFMDICLDTTVNGTTFTDKSGNTVSIGLIPDCSVTGGAPPCVSSRKKNAGNEVITFTLPAGDPHTSWY